MNSYKVEEVKPDGYVRLLSTDSEYQTQLPLKSIRIMYEYGSIDLKNPEEIY